MLEARSEHYAPSAPRRAAPPGARGCSRSRGRWWRPTAPCGCWRRAASAPRRSSSARPCWSCGATGWRSRTSRCSLRGLEATELTAQVFSDYGIPVAREQRTPLASTRLGAGLLAFARAALGTGTAKDVVTWLRTPGKLAAAAVPGGPDAPPPRRSRGAAAPDARRRRGPARGGRPPHRRALGRARRGGSGSAAAGGRWRSSTRWPRAETAEAFLALFLAEAESIWTAPHIRQGHVLSPEAEADARAAAALRSAVAELTRLAAADEALAGTPAELLEALAAVEVRESGAAAEGVLLADPLAIRARRFRAVIVCGLQDGELPRRPQPEPFLDDDARGGLAVASRPRAAAPRGHAGPRALALLLRRLAARGGAAARLPDVRRGGRAAAAVAVRRRRPRALHRRAVDRPRPAAARRGHLAAGRGADAARAAPRAGGRRGSRGPGAAAGAGRRPRCWPSWRGAIASPRAGWRRSPPAACAGSSSSCCGPTSSSRTRRRCAAARSSTPCSSGRCAG